MFTLVLPSFHLSIWGSCYHCISRMRLWMFVGFICSHHRNQQKSILSLLKFYLGNTNNVICTLRLSSHTSEQTNTTMQFSVHMILHKAHNWATYEVFPINRRQKQCGLQYLQFNSLFCHLCVFPEVTFALLFYKHISYELLPFQKKIIFNIWYLLRHIRKC